MSRPLPQEVSALPPTARAGSAVAVQNIRTRYHDVVAVDDVSLDVPAGSFLALLGPSGSGKTTILMTIAGFVAADHGRVLIAGRDVTDVPPHRRGLGMVFQRYALFPHLSVHDNVAYPLHRRGVRGSELRDLVRDALELVHLSGHDTRMPDQLSGGQQQRVALARALVYRPPVLLMDEPLGALDRKLRDELQIEIKQIQRALGTTVIFVTHDQQEALQMADQIAVLRQGRIEQLGAPAELYEAPQTAFIADFLGEANMFAGTIEADALRLADGTALPARLIGNAGRGIGRPGRMALRPTAVRLGDDGLLPVSVIDTVYGGETTAVLLRLASGEQMTARLPAREAAAFQRGDATRAGWSTADARIFLDV